MSLQKPLILADDPISGVVGQPIIQQLQVGQELDIPLEDRYQKLNIAFVRLLEYIIEEGFNLPESLVYYIEENL